MTSAAYAILVLSVLVFAYVITSELGDDMRRGVARLFRKVFPARSDFRASARRTPDRLETGQAAGGAPGTEGARPGAGAPGAVPPHPRFGELAATPPEGITVRLPGATVYVGRHSAGLPRRRPSGEGAPWPAAERPGVVVPSMLPLTGPMPAVSEPVFGEAPVARLLGVADLGPADARGRGLAERMIP